MSVQNPERVVTKQDLKDFYDGILPYLGSFPEVVANKFSKGDLYSTDEKMIGQWIDGKPLYQKSFDTTIPSSNGVMSNTLLSNDCNVLDVLVNLINSNGDTITAHATYKDHLIFYYKPNIGVFAEINNASWATNRGAVVTLKYTKSTDSAVSMGDDTDYSTTEKIVGTWIDGKPIYQKTYDVGSSSSGEVKNIDSNLTTSNARLIGYEGFGYKADGNNVWNCLPDISRAVVTHQAYVTLESNGLKFVNSNTEGTRSSIYVTVRYLKITV